MNNLHQQPKKYPKRHYAEQYATPRESPRRQILQKQNSPDAKVFIVSLILIVAILGFFFAKKSIQEKNKLAKEKQTLEENLFNEADLDLVYVSSENAYKGINDENIQLLDIREPAEYALKHIESSLNLPLSQVGEKINLVSKTKEVIVIDSDHSQVGKIFTDHLRREGVDAKYLDGGILSYAKNGYGLISKGNPTITGDLIKVDSLSAEEIKNKIKGGQLFVFVDVRPKTEYASDNIDGSINIPLEKIETSIKKIPFGTILIYDSHALRSFQAAVKLNDMNMISVYNCLDEYAVLKETLNNATKQTEQKTPSQPKENESPQTDTDPVPK